MLVKFAENDFAFNLQQRTCEFLIWLVGELSDMSDWLTF